MLKRNETVLWRELDGEAVLLDAAAGCTYHLNRVGTLIWNLLDGRHTAGEIASAICEAFEVEQEQALHDMQRLVDELRQQQLLQSDERYGLAADRAWVDELRQQQLLQSDGPIAQTPGEADGHENGT